MVSRGILPAMMIHLETPLEPVWDAGAEAPFRGEVSPQGEAPEQEGRAGNRRTGKKAGGVDGFESPALLHGLLDDAGLSAQEFRVMLHICRRSGLHSNGRHCEASAESMAETCRLGVRTVRLALKSLVSLGWVVAIERPGFTKVYRPVFASGEVKGESAIRTAARKRVKPVSSSSDGKENVSVAPAPVDPAPVVIALSPSGTPAVSCQSPSPSACEPITLVTGGTTLFVTGDPMPLVTAEVIPPSEPNKGTHPHPSFQKRTTPAFCLDSGDSSDASHRTDETPGHARKSQHDVNRDLSNEFSQDNSTGSADNSQSVPRAAKNRAMDAAPGFEMDFATGGLMDRMPGVKADREAGHALDGAAFSGRSGGVALMEETAEPGGTAARKGKESGASRVTRSRGTVEEVREFVAGMGLPASDGEFMFHKWEANGWLNGPRPIKDWKAQIRSWKAARYLPSQRPDARQGMNSNNVMVPAESGAVMIGGRVFR